MDVKVNSIKLEDADAVIIPLFEEDNEVPESFKLIFKGIKDKEKFKGESKELFSASKDLQDILFLGLGKECDKTLEKVREAFSKAVKKVRSLKDKKVFVYFDQKTKTEEILKASVEGLILGDYEFVRYKSDKKEKASIETSVSNISSEELSKVQAYVDEAVILSQTTLYARDLVNEPANVLYPETLAEQAVLSGKKYGFEVEVFDESKIQELGMKAFFSVAKASDNPPRLIVMRYFGDKGDTSNIIGLIGKGLTYDSGGYSIKTNNGMLTMKSDMGGAAAVIGAMSSIAHQKLKVNVVGVVAACENLISGGAYKPGDVIGSMAGKTIEVMSTDAEGRLTLADAVYYAITKEKASKVVDIATLTGAAVSAIGTVATAVVANDKKFYEELESASSKSGEKVWLFPSFDEYRELIKSDIADLKNTGGRLAGAITAGLFIEEFVEKKPWLHLDIAGTSWSDSERSYYSKGATGVGVRTLYYLVKSEAK